MTIDALASNAGHAVAPSAASLARAFLRDYKLPSELRGLIDAARRPSLWSSVTAALADHCAILCALTAASWGYRSLPLPAAFVVHVLGLISAARFQRGLECLLHEACHYNWSRKSHRLNDILADFLAALPCFSRVRQYRPGHMRHHAFEGANVDPDRIRYEQLALEELDRSSRIEFAVGVAKRVAPYAFGWWRAIGANTGTFLAAAAWHAAFVVLPATLLGGTEFGAFLGLNWLVAFFVVLPPIRLIAEAGEHRYIGQTTLLSSTISNHGRMHWLLFHPHNDGYHVAHHLWPSVPHHQLRRLHENLVQRDRTFAVRALHRTSPVQNPESGWMNATEGGDTRAATT